MNLKKHILILLVAFTSTNVNSQTKVMSYNIRVDNLTDGINSWDSRKKELYELINFYNPDFLGIQEGMFKQVQFLSKNLKNYSYIGFGRDGKEVQSEAVPIFFNNAKFELIKKETFWLSETPEIVSKGWDANYNRISTYGIFRNKITNDTIHIFNCHFDHMGELARKNSSKLIIKKINQYGLSDNSVIVMGDLNCLPEDKPYKILNKSLGDALKISEQKPYGPRGTWNGFDTNKIISERIDYIFCKGLSVLNYRNIDDRRLNNLYLSDHLPVFIEIK